MPRYLMVPFEEKEEAKRLGAQWDSEVKRWYIPDTRDTAQFEQWIPKSPPKRQYPTEVPLPEKNPDSASYTRFREWYSWWLSNLPVVEHKDHIGTFIRIGAICG
jgi:hypothetical protein